MYTMYTGLCIHIEGRLLSFDVYLIDTFEGLFALAVKPGDNFQTASFSLLQYGH